MIYFNSNKVNDAIEEFFNHLNGIIDTMPLVTYEYHKGLAVWYLNSIMGILQSALGFRKKYSTFFDGNVDILWDNIDT